MSRDFSVGLVRIHMQSKHQKPRFKGGTLKKNTEKRSSNFGTRSQVVKTHSLHNFQTPSCLELAQKNWRQSDEICTWSSLRCDNSDAALNSQKQPKYDF